MHGVRINAFKAFQLIGKRDVVGTKFLVLGFVHDAIGVKQPSAIAFDIKGLMFSRNFLLRCEFVF